LPCSGELENIAEAGIDLSNSPDECRSYQGAPSDRGCARKSTLNSEMSETDISSPVTLQNNRSHDQARDWKYSAYAGTSPSNPGEKATVADDSELTELPNAHPLKARVDARISGRNPDSPTVTLTICEHASMTGGAGFEPAIPGSGGLCPILARLRERIRLLYPPIPARHCKRRRENTSSLQLAVASR
jgi:hypothetical protein